MDTTCPDCGGEHSLDVSCANAKAGQIASLSADNERLRAALRQTTGELEDLYAMIKGEAPSLLEDHHSVPKIEAAIAAGSALLSPTAGREVVCVPKEPTPEMVTYEEHEACFGPRTDGEGK
jgi:hypothetical protein